MWFRQSNDARGDLSQLIWGAATIKPERLAEPHGEPISHQELGDRGQVTMPTDGRQAPCDCIKQ